MANNDVIAPLPSVATHIFDPASQEWTIAEPLEGPVLLYSLLKLRDGKVLALGVGGAEGRLGSNARLFDSEENSWADMPIWPANHALPKLVLLEDGRVLTTGGLGFFNLAAFPSSDTTQPPEIAQPPQILQLTTGEWEQVAPLPEYFSLSEDGPPLITLPDGRVLAVGTMTEGSGSVAHAELYDPNSNVWTTIQGPEPDFLPSDAVGLSNGEVFVIGTTGSLVVQGKLFDPLSNSWTPAAEMNHPRLDATFTLLPDGRVLAVGGTDNSSLRIFERSEEKFLPVTEIYDPATNTWSLGPEMQVPRTEHAATALPDGRVLITGGIGIEPESGERYPLASVEIIDLFQAP